MALNLSKVDGTLEVIVSADGALTCGRDAWIEYSKKLDESFLSYVEGQQPTKFILKKSLDFKGTSAVKSKQVRFNMEGQAQFDVGYILDEIRYALVDIKNPDNLPEDQKIKYIRDSDGYCSKELIAKLESVGAVQDMFTCRQNLLAADKDTNLAKKS